MRRTATFDSTSQYRYRLGRFWNAALPRVTFVMLNPSTADHRQDDPTIRRCIGFARDWGFGSLVVVNLFAFRTPSPARLARAPAPVGPDNDRALRRARGESALVVAAWGNHGRLRDRDREVRALLDDRAVCLGMTKLGQPRHPLYVRRDARPTRWR